MAATDLLRALVRERVTFLNHMKMLEERLRIMHEASSPQQWDGLAEVIEYFSTGMSAHLVKQGTLLSLMTMEDPQQVEIPHFLGDEEESLIAEARDLLMEIRNIRALHDPVRFNILLSKIAAFSVRTAIFIMLQDNALFPLLIQSSERISPIRPLMAEQGAA